jgi:flavin reductase (DIM6/NTAB) family NADH-FMN oxidoreductase RutF
MDKVSVGISNNFCPQALFLYGTYKEDGTPNFGLFCWFSYCWDDGLAVMACIGGSKLTKDRINANGVFSANLVTESLLPLADYFGNKEGYDPDKMSVPVETVNGQVLNVPILKNSPWSYELQVKQSISLNGSDIYICGIRNILADAELAKGDKSVELRARLAAPVLTTAKTYFKFGGRIGSWGDWKK